MRIGLFFGSFNPVHVGHLIIANHLSSLDSLDQVWMVISPQNPFKKKQSLANNYDRLHLVRLAIADHPKLRASDIEFDLPTPSYTIHTLAYLNEKYPQHDFSLIMGSDNLKNFHKWKNAEHIIAHHDIYVYQRPNAPPPTRWIDHPRVHILHAPLLDISSSYIRRLIAEDISFRYLVTEPVYEYIAGSNMYKPKQTKESP